VRKTIGRLGLSLICIGDDAAPPAGQSLTCLDHIADQCRWLAETDD
jgi:hypothetical protein